MNTPTASTLKNFSELARRAAWAVGRFQSMAVLAVVYLLVVVPTGLLLRCFSRRGADGDGCSNSAWIPREKAGSMERPF